MDVAHQVNSADYTRQENHRQIIERAENDQTPKKCFLVGGVELVAEDNQDDIDDDADLIVLTPLSVKRSNKRDSICVEDYKVRRKQSKPFKYPSVTEKGESSNSGSTTDETVFVEEEAERIGVWKKFVCEICADSKLQIDAFAIKGCTHSYCLDCINNLVVTKLEAGFSNITCPVPNCNGMLEPDYCRHIIPSDVFNRWGDLLCESVIDVSQKFYCPFKYCSALSILDGDENITSSECPTCHRLFCAQCKDVWHVGINCSEYQKLGKGERSREDLMVRELAQTKKWQRCPKCKFYVEKKEGCNQMTCRCHVSFCYVCGKSLINAGRGCH